MDLPDINKHVASRARVRIVFGPARGMTGFLLGYNDQYDTVRVGFLDDEGNYSGEKTTQARTSVVLAGTLPTDANTFARMHYSKEDLSLFRPSSMRAPNKKADLTGKTFGPYTVLFSVEHPEYPVFRPRVWLVRHKLGHYRALTPLALRYAAKHHKDDEQPLQKTLPCPVIESDGTACDRLRRAHGMCHVHGQRMQRYGDPLVVKSAPIPQAKVYTKEEADALPTNPKEVRRHGRLEGRTFGPYTVERLTFPPSGSASTMNYWVCQHTDGTYRVMRADALRRIGRQELRDIW